MDNSLKCTICEKSYSTVSNLRKHVRNLHPDESDTIAPRSYGNSSKYNFSCEVCGNNFNDEFNFRAHMKTHNSNLDSVEEQDKITKYSKKCPMCEYCSPYKKKLLEHFTAQHDISLISEDIQVPSENDFYEWKNEVEHTSLCKFVKERAVKNSSIHETTYFVCHRSGYYVPEGSGERHLKTSGSKKINAYCPAGIKMLKKGNGTCDISYLKTHVGHKNELRHLQLTSSERRNIAEKIALKIPLDSILDDIRVSMSDVPCERIHIVTKKDLYNIEASFNLASSSVRHQNDAISVESWVIQMREEGDCVLFYKNQQSISEEHPCLKEDDFVLIIMTSAQCELLKKYGSDCICLDGTHGMNSYDFELNTLLVLDDLREGFPCAFLISNRSDKDVLKIFFSYIKLKTGIITPKIFMTDMADSYYNAWLETMGTPERRLYCTWHVERAWQKNLVKIKTKEKQVEIYKHLHTLLQERDADAFEKMFEGFLLLIRNDPCTTEFGHYFQQNYAENYRAWAYCYRLYAGINTNMSLERMHGTIKYYYLKGKSVKRLDKGIAAIMRYIRDKLFDRLITIHKGKISSKIRNIRIRHKKSFDLDPNLVIPAENGWEVCSKTTQEMYQIQINNEPCSCQLVCTDCEICIHRYWCSCVDSSIKFNMCKHIHLIAKYNKQKESTEEQTSNVVEHRTDNLLPEIDVARNTECKIILQQLSKSTNTPKCQSLDEQKEILINRITKLIKNIQSPTKLNIAKRVTDMLDPILTAADNVKNRTFPRTSSNHVTHNINAQRRLWSTKKKRKKTKTVMKKPSAEESTQIAMSLLLNN